MEVFGHFVFPRFSGFFRAFPFIYRLFWAFLFTIHFRHFVLPPILLSSVFHNTRYSPYIKINFLDKGNLYTIIFLCVVYLLHMAP